MTGWQWHQLMDHVQIICTSLQTDNHTSTPPLYFLQAGCPSCRRTNSVKALKARISTHTASEYSITVSFSTSNAVKQPINQNKFIEQPRHKWIRGMQWQRIGQVFTFTVSNVKYFRFQNTTEIDSWQIDNRTCCRLTRLIPQSKIVF